LVSDVGERGRPAIGIGAPDLLGGFICVVGRPWLVMGIGTARHGSLDGVVVGLFGAGFLGHETASRFLVEA